MVGEVEGRSPAKFSAGKLMELELWWPVPAETCPKTLPAAGLSFAELCRGGFQDSQETTQNPQIECLGGAARARTYSANFLWPTRDPSPRYPTKKNKSPITLRGSHRQLFCKQKRQDGEPPYLPDSNSHYGGTDDDPILDRPRPLQHVDPRQSTPLTMSYSRT